MQIRSFVSSLTLCWSHLVLWLCCCCLGVGACHCASVLRIQRTRDCCKVVGLAGLLPPRQTHARRDTHRHSTTKQMPFWCSMSLFILTTLKQVMRYPQLMWAGTARGNAKGSGFCVSMTFLGWKVGSCNAKSNRPETDVNRQESSESGTGEQKREDCLLLQYLL